MSNVYYLTFNEKEPMMASFGIIVKTITKEENMNQFVRELERKQVEIVYISNDVYRTYETFFNENEGDVAFILFDSNDPTSSLARRRLQNLLASSIGIQTR
ncbi:MAG TPA: hypothetical protein VKY25_04580 [Erysipelothrix sp.]|nr:hypothetical protein [Erysipelothrix sp.]